MFSMCSELTPRARIPDTRIPQLMEPWPFKFSFYQSTLRHSCLCLIKLYVATFCIIVIIIIIYPLLSRRRFLHSFLTLPSSSPLRPLETFIWHSHHPPRPNHIEWNDYPKFSFTTITKLWFSWLVQLRYCYSGQPFGEGIKGHKFSSNAYLLFSR